MFAENPVSFPPRRSKLGIEVQNKMKICSGSVAFPLCLILAGILLAMDRFGIIQVSHLWNLWPVILIAAGMEKLYLWTVTPGERENAGR